MRPYYEQSGVTIYHADCREVMDEWAGLRTQRFDLLLTDPPYGIGAASAGFISHRKIAGRKGIAHDYGASEWDDRPAYEAIALARRISRWQIIFGGNYYDLPPMKCWLVWDKDNGASGFGDCELAWTNLDKAVRKLTHRSQGMLTQPGYPKEDRWHPTQKPEAVMRWAFMQAPQDVRTVLDPFMGSGTTLVACKRLGRACVGIERDERYCEIAVKRLAQEALPMEVT